MILADENIDHSLIEAIRSIGIEVYSVYELNRGIRDDEIIAFSRNPPRIILTEDKDFGEWVFVHNVQGISVLLLHYHFREALIMQKILIDLLSNRLPELIGCFTTLTTQKIRKRKI